jgi:hypothetical protein
MASWVARVEWRDGIAMSDIDLLSIAASLSAYNTSVGREHEAGRISASLSLEASTLRQAAVDALRIVRGAVSQAGHPFHPVGVEVLDEPTFVARLAQSAKPPLVGYAEIAEIANLSHREAQELSDVPGFPPAVVETRAGPLRVRLHVEAWLATWEREHGRPREASDPDARQDARPDTP